MGCCCRNVSKETMSKAKKIKQVKGIYVLGGGCKNCHKLMQNTIGALAELGRNDNVEMITDFSVIASYGVMSTPALVIDGKVVSAGKVLSTEEVKAKLA